MTRCAVCNHPERESFEKQLALERTSAADVARIIGCNRSTVTRHLRNHLIPEMRQSYQANAEPELKALDVLAEMRELYARMKQHLADAEAAKDWQAIKSFHSEARKDLELLAKLLGELQQEGTINVSLSPEWLSIRTVILQAVTPYPEAAKAITAALSASERVQR
jgi:AcrR family transcriptional regulator